MTHTVCSASTPGPPLEHALLTLVSSREAAMRAHLPSGGSAASGRSDPQADGVADG